MQALFETGATGLEPATSGVTGRFLFGPVGDIVSATQAALDGGGRLAIFGVHVSDVSPFDYDRLLLQERPVRGVTASSRRDGEKFLEIAARMYIPVETVCYPLERARWSEPTWR